MGSMGKFVAASDITLALAKGESPSHIDDAITISDVEEVARKRLPGPVYDYYASGSDEQQALRRNVDAFSR